MPEMKLDEVFESLVSRKNGAAIGDQERGGSSNRTSCVDLTNVNLDGLHFLRLIGSGGMSDVWLARDQELDLEVAVKVLPPDLGSNHDYVVRFLREARAVARLSHPNIVRVLQAGRREFKGEFIRLMVMEYVDGSDAETALTHTAKGRMDPTQALILVLPVAMALEYAHRKGVVHRDIKPANILISSGEGTVKVGDFGLARMYLRNRVPGDEAGNISHHEGWRLLGTPQYMAPEQAEGRSVDGRADVYSLGITLYELLTGALPFDGDSVLAIIAGHMNQPLQFPEDTFRDVPQELRELISGMCAKQAADRLPVGSVIDSLQSMLKSVSTVESSRYEVLEKASPSGKRIKESSGSAAGIPGNLRAKATSFVGREAEIAELQRLVGGTANSSTLVTILGPGGVGKTRLAQEVGLSLQSRYPGGVWFCDLADSLTLNGICHAVAQGLGVPLNQQDSLQQITNILSMREPMLLVLDNFEQIVDLAPACIGRWRTEAPHVSILATSRTPLHLEEERTFLLEPLQESGVQLFMDRARSSRRNLVFTPTQIDVIKDIVERLDGLPLAIELAAARVATLQPEQILQRLSQRFDMLKGRTQGIADRQQTLRNTIEWSWQLLTPWEQSTLAQVSVFKGGFFLDAAEAVVDLSEFEEAPLVLDVIETLVMKSLVVSAPFEGVAGELRFRLMESIREFAVEKAQEVTELERTLALRLLSHCKNYISTWGLEVSGPKSTEAMTRIELEIDNAFRAMDLCMGTMKDADLHDVAVRDVASMLISMAPTLRVRGPWRDRIPRLEQVQGSLDLVSGDEQSRTGDTLALKMRLCHALAVAHLDTGTVEGADAAAGRAESLVKALSDSNFNEPALQLLARVCQQYAFMRSARFQEAGVAIDEALKSLDVNLESVLERSRGQPLWLRQQLAACVGDRGTMFLHAGKYQEARNCYAAAERMNQELGNESGVSTNVSNRGLALQRLGDWQSAVDCQRQAETLNRRLGHRTNLARCLGNCGTVYDDQGLYEDALLCYAEAEKISRELGDRVGVAIWVGNRGNALRVLGRLDDAWSALSEAELLCRSINAVRPLTFWLIGKAMILLRQQREHQQAKDLAREACDLRKTMGMQETREYFESLATQAVAAYRCSDFHTGQTLANTARELGLRLNVPRISRTGAPLEHWRFIEEASQPT